MISKVVLVFAESFGATLNAGRVADAIGRGLQSDGQLECDLCPYESPSQAFGEPTEHPSKLLERLDVDRRMRAARAVVIAVERLESRALLGSAACEAATRARQGGVPAYAVSAHDELGPFEARIVDLQVILEASTPRTLSAAGRKLAELV